MINNQLLIIVIFQIATLYNIYCLGWTIKKIDDRTYELTKKMTNANNFQLDIFLDKITTFAALPESLSNALSQNVI